MHYNIIGYIGSLVLIVSAFPQVYKCYKEGHAVGISAAMILMWILGMNLMLLYVCIVYPTSYVLIGNYLINVIISLILFKYKYFPRVKSDMSITKHRE